MAKFNPTKTKRTPVLSKARGGDTVNLAGGQAYSVSAEAELVSVLTTSFVNDQYYRSAGETLNRFVSLVEQCDPMFVAQAAIFARNTFGMRSITHVAAGEIARLVKDKTWTKDFFKAVVRRPDDMLEIMAYFKRYATPKTISDGKSTKTVYRRLPNSLRRGLAEAFGKFDAYQLAKYRGQDAEFSLIDILRLVHPRSTDKNREALKMLVFDSLKSKDTWEAALSKAGQDAAGDRNELTKLKAEAWNDLISSRKLGYFALLRNLRNITEQAPSAVPLAAAMLVDKKLIEKSLVMPFRYLTAYRAMTNSQDGELRNAISTAINVACSNVPTFKGRTLICVDKSGSMTDDRLNGKKSSVTPADIAALFAVLMLKRNTDADLMLFDERARYIKPDTKLPVMKCVGEVTKLFSCAGTDFKCIFNVANKAYDRIIILSDMQGWVGFRSPSGKSGVFEKYKKNFDCNPYVYCFDLAGYGSSQFDPNDNKVFMFSGFSEKVFDIMKLCESDKNALINEIKKVKFTDEPKDETLTD